MHKKHVLFLQLILSKTKRKLHFYFNITIAKTFMFVVKLTLYMFTLVQRLIHSAVEPQEFNTGDKEWL